MLALDPKNTYFLLLSIVFYLLQAKSNSACLRIVNVVIIYLFGIWVESFIKFADLLVLLEEVMIGVLFMQ